MKLSDLGFKKGYIAECIITTYNQNGSPNAAPMGVYALGEKELEMKVHTNSDTCRNLINNRGCVINITFDPFLFLKTALLGRGRAEKEPEVRKSEISKAKLVHAPFLKDANAFIEAELKSHKEYIKKDEYKPAEFSVMKCRAVRAAVNKKYPVATNRGLNAAIELAVELSRGKKNNAGLYMRIMQKTLGAREYKKIEKFIERFL